MDNESLKAQLTLAYKSFQYYADRLSSDELDGLDDWFIDAYDHKDVQHCKAALRAMGEVLHSLTEGDMVKASERKAY